MLPKELREVTALTQLQNVKSPKNLPQDSASLFNISLQWLNISVVKCWPVSIGAADRGDGTQQLLGHKAIKRLKKKKGDCICPVAHLYIEHPLKKSVQGPALRTFSEFYFFFLKLSVFVGVPSVYNLLWKRSVLAGSLDQWNRPTQSGTNVSGPFI